MSTPAPVNDPVNHPVNLWTESGHAVQYLEKRGRLTRLQEGYAAMLELLTPPPTRVLDLGCGDGEVIGRIVEQHPDVDAIACDFSPEMLGRARARFDGTRVRVVEHDLDEPLPGEWGTFDTVVSAFAIHHVVDERKRALYGEVLERLGPGGRFCNLEHVASPTPELHATFLAAVEADEDPSNKLVPVDVQLDWLRELGFAQVDCFWKWRELALLCGQRPA